MVPREKKQGEMFRIRGGARRKRRFEDSLEDDKEENKERTEEEETVDGKEAEKQDSPPGWKKHRSYFPDKENDDNEEEGILSSEVSAIRKINPIGRPAECGIIHRVYVENFMCHKKMTIDLCRNVNFIHGQNGSGKSAVLAAVQICLGAGARRTHRARNLKDLIRKGWGGKSVVKVRLLNRGDDAYEHDLYGDYVTVERTIERNGSGGYRLLDEHEAVKSMRRGDLDSLLDHLNIQVDNPVAVLDQEEAKRFLTGKPEDKYAFFTKATELERIDRTYASGRDNITQYQEQSERVRTSVQPALLKVKSMEERWKEYKELDKMEDRVAEARVNYVWSFWKELNEELKIKQKTQNEAKKKLEKRREELQAFTASASEKDPEEETIAKEIYVLDEEAKKAAVEKQRLGSELRASAFPLKEEKHRLKSCQRELSTSNKKLDSARLRLRETREQAAAAAGNAEGETAARAKKMTDLEAAINDNRSSSDDLKPDIEKLHRRYEEMEPAVHQCREDLAAADRQLKAVVRRLQELHSDAGGSMAVFGEKCVEMHRRVQMEKSFKGPVAGPIGASLKIKEGKEDFAKLAESTLVGLDRFVCTNDHDRVLLMKIRADLRCTTRQCGIFQMNDAGKRYDVQEVDLGEGIETVSTVLSVEDDLVFNCLVHNRKIDQRALCKSKEASESALLSTDANGRECIKEEKIQCVHFFPRGDFWQCQRGMRTVTSNEKGLTRLTIGVDRSAAVKETEREHGILKKEVIDMKKREVEMVKKHKQVKVQWNAGMKKLHDLSSKIKRDQSKLDDLKNEPDMLVNVNAIDTSELEEDVTECEEAVKLLKDNEVDTKRKIDELSPSVKDIQKKLEEVTARNDRVITDLDKATDRMEKVQYKQQQRDKEAEKKKRKCDQIEQAVQENEAQLLAEKIKENDALMKAKLLTHRTCAQKEHLDGNHTTNNSINLSAIEPVETDRKPEYYQKKIERMTRQLNEEKEKRRLNDIDPEDLLEKLQAAKEDLELKMKTVKSIEESVEMLARDLKVRKKKWHRFRSHIASSTNLTFDQILNKRGSSGELEFDHKEGTLNLTVQKDNADEGSQTKDVKALSGGERSFTTLALLLALGENLETPFRVMDEFDVFLDPVMRKIAIDNMIQAAKTMEHRQFIFITPQDLSSLTPDRMLKIVQMKTPARDDYSQPQQTTLPFTSP